MYHGRRIAVVIPAHNEGAFIRETLAAVPAFVDEIVAIDDHSDDDTVAEILASSGIDPRIQFVPHLENRGVGAAIVTGFKACLERQADVVAVMDGDGQMHPDDLSTLLEPICAGRADMAKGNRFDRFRVRGPMPTSRWIGNLALSTATRIVSGYGESLDAQCGYVALSSHTLRTVPLDSLFPRYGFPNDLFLRVVEASLRVEMVPIRAVYGDEISGIRPHVAIPPILYLLIRGLGRRFRLSVAGLRNRRTTLDEQL